MVKGLWLHWCRSGQLDPAHRSSSPTLPTRPSRPRRRCCASPTTPTGGLGPTLVHWNNMPGHQVQVIPIAKLVTKTKVSAASSVRRGSPVTAVVTVSSARQGLGCRPAPSRSTTMVSCWPRRLLPPARFGSRCRHCLGECTTSGCVPRHDGRLADQQGLGPGHRHLTASSASRMPKAPSTPGASTGLRPY